MVGLPVTEFGVRSTGLECYDGSPALRGSYTLPEV